MMEGIGYGCADWALHRGRPCARLFAVVGGDEPPQCAMLPLHTGAGLAFAERALQSAQDSGVGTATVRFWRECQEMPAAGYAEPMFEALGLVTITRYPHLIQQMIANFRTYTRTSALISGTGWDGDYIFRLLASSRFPVAAA